MAKVDDSGPAFPTLIGLPPEASANGRMGMTLRDWFAGQAICGLSVQVDGNYADAEDAAKVAYETADAMLAARKMPIPEVV